jgi:hypothetical protein
MKKRLRRLSVIAVCGMVSLCTAVAGSVAATPGPGSENLNSTRSSSNWSLRPGLATAIGVGANGSVWVVGTNRVGGGFGIWLWTGGGWAEVPGGAVAIAVDPGGKPWVVNSVHSIYRWGGSAWTLVRGAGSDIGVGAGYIDKLADGYRIAGQFGFSSGCHHPIYLNRCTRHRGGWTA